MEPAGERHAAAVDTDDREGGGRIGVALDDLVGHSNESTRDIVAVEHDLFRCIQLRASFLASRDRVKGGREECISAFRWAASAPHRSAPASACLSLIHI